MSSRDSDNKPKGRDGNAGSEADAPANPRSRFFDVDPADIDRYLSGRPQRTPSGTGESRQRARTGNAPTQGSGTASQLERLQKSVSEASRTRRQPQPPQPENPAPPARTSQAASAAQSSYRSNRRRSYMEEDPYVSGYEDEPAPEIQYRSIPEQDDVYEEDWQEDVPDIAPPRRQRTAREPRARVSRPAIQRPNIQKPSLPPAIANADIVNDLSALVFVGISTVSLALMAIIVANRVGTLPEVIPTHVSASGLLENYASRSTIWQVPLLALMLTLMNIVAAWFVSPLDRFASRFLLATSVVVQFVAWVALLRILW